MLRLILVQLLFAGIYLICESTANAGETLEQGLVRARIDAGLQAGSRLYVDSKGNFYNVDLGRQGQIIRAEAVNPGNPENARIIFKPHTPETNPDLFKNIKPAQGANIVGADGKTLVIQSIDYDYSGADRHKINYQVLGEGGGKTTAVPVTEFSHVVRPVSQSVYVDPHTGRFYEVELRDGKIQSAKIWRQDQTGGSRYLDDPNINGRLKPLIGTEVSTLSGGIKSVDSILFDEASGQHKVRYALPGGQLGETSLGRVAAQVSVVDGAKILAPGNQVTLNTGERITVKDVFSDGTIRDGSGRVFDARRSVPNLSVVGEKPSAGRGVKFGAIAFEAANALPGAVTTYASAAIEEAIARGECPTAFGRLVDTQSSRAALDTLQKHDPGVWNAVAEDCAKKGISIELHNAVKPLKGQGGFSSAKCQSDGRIEIIEQSGHKTIFAFKDENSLVSIVTAPQEARIDSPMISYRGKLEHGRDFMVTYGTDGKEAKEEILKLYARYGCAAKDDKAFSETSTQADVDALCGKDAPRLPKSTNLKLAESFLRARELLIAAGDGRTNYKKICTALGGKLPETVSYIGKPAQPTSIASESGKAITTADAAAAH